MGRLQDFEAMALPHMDAAHSLAFWLVRSRPDAEDIVQDAYLRAFRAFDSFAGDNFKAWLLTIVRNLAYRWHSVRQKSANVISLDEVLHARDEGGPGAMQLASGAPSVEALLIGAAEQALVRKALAELPPVFREVIVLREIEGLSYQDIADVAGVPTGTVMSRLSRARGQLKARLSALIELEDKNAVR
ncbi:MAG: sigma-70 family RNA polymerase sigma factor [Proteobacteria bacterium]|nr:sigma-70 family RNA polymerase sigma factor [Pseudomonadota bacterium]